MFLNKINEEEKIENFWEEYRDFCEDLPNVNYDLFISALPKLIKRLENNNTTRRLDDALENLSKKDSKIGKNLYSKIFKIGNPSISPQLSPIISGLFHSDTSYAVSKTKELILKEDNNLKKIGIETIAKFDLSNKKCSKEFLDWLNTYLLELVNDKQYSNLWASIFFVCRNRRNELKVSYKVINILASKPKIEIQSELLSYLSYNLDLEKEIDVVEKYLINLQFIDLKYKGVYGQLSYFLENLIKNHSSIVLKYLENWVKQSIENARKIGYFRHLLNTLYDEYYQEFQKLYTCWLNDNNPNFHIAIFEMSRAGELHDTSHLTLSEELFIKYSIYDIEFITYKILAYVYDKDTSLSLIYSILEQKSDDNEVVRFISDVFVDYLIFNYYSAIDFLKEKKIIATPKLKKVIQDIIKQGEKNYSAYSDLKLLKEFAPSERRLNEYYKIQNKKFSKSFKESESETNFLSSITKNIQFKAGKAIFSKYNGVYTKEMIPALISHSAEMPRGEYIDPVGQAKLRLFWQNFKRQK